MNAVLGFFVCLLSTAFVRCIVGFIGAQNLSVSREERTEKTTLRLFRPKTLFVIMLRRQTLVKEVRVFRWQR